MDISSIDSYLATNGIDATVHESGLRYVISGLGSGPYPTWYEKVKFQFSGKLLSNGSQFGSGIAEPKQGFDGRLINYVQGLQIGLQLLRPGGKATFFVPSVLAYGSFATSDIPANSNLIFEVELLEVTQ